jgi:hypothetical protein
MSFIDWALEWSDDLQFDVNGDILLNEGLDRIRQFIERRILTTPLDNPIINLRSTPDYLFDTGYGIGAGALVDREITGQFRDTTQQVILQGIKQEPGVAPFPPPSVSLLTTPGGLFQVLATYFAPPFGFGKVGFKTQLK